MSDTGFKSTWLIEVGCYIDGTGESTLYYSDTGYNSLPSDTPANQHYSPRLVSPGSVARSIFDQGTTFGATSVGYGVVVLGNSDGALDALRDYGWSRSVVIKQITARQPEKAALSTAVRRFAGVVDHIESDFDEIRLVLRDELALLDVPIQGARFAGTSTGATGIEGDATLEGAPKPMAFGGALRNITPALANASNEVYAWNHDTDGATAATAAVSAARNGGATYTLSGTDRANLAAMEAATPTAGQADTCLAESLLRTNGSVTAAITLDVTVAPQVTNLATYSAQLDNGAWTKTRTSVSANDATAPDGNATADKIVEDGTASSTHFIEQACTITAADPVMASVYLAFDERTRARVAVEGASGTLYVDANLSAGTLGSATATGGYSGATATITAAGGFYLVKLLGSTATDTSVAIRVYLADSGGSITYDGDSASGLHAWGAMLAVTSDAQPYIPTVASPVAARPKASAARVAEAILAEIGYAIDEASLVALDGKNSAPVALYLESEFSALAAAQQALDSIGGYLIATNAGTYKVGRFEAPTGSARKAIQEWEIADDGGYAIDMLPTDDEGTGVPIYRVVFGFDRNWTPQPPDGLAGSVSQADRAAYAEDGKRLVVEDTAILTKHPEAREIEIPSLLEQESDASTEATRRLAFLKAEKRRFRVPLHWTRAVWDADGSTPLEEGDHVTLEMSRFGLSVASDFVVIGTEADFDGGVVFVDIVRSEDW